MPKTPDRHPGSAYDNELQFVDDGLGEPQTPGAMHFNQGVFRICDAVGVYNPRRLWSAFLDGAASESLTSGTVYTTTTPTNPVTQKSYYSDAAKTLLLARTTYSYTGPLAFMPSSVTYKLYAADGITVAHTCVETLTYVNSFYEASSTRVFS